MTIVNNVKDKLPNQGDVVFCDNGKYAPDRALFKGGKFIGGGDYPVKEYSMSFVSKWFDLDVYDYCKGGGSYGVSFKDAELMSSEGYKKKVKVKHESSKPYSQSFKLGNGKIIMVNHG
uniref:Uncharacterized protein n=1 Tax=uncultured marine virus TaxID=186617 RepID=A0A0F7L5K7_9VIRU|nr:hypothetical protein [uncultured marine virus]